MGHLDMQSRKADTSTTRTPTQPSLKARWHTPVFKQLDVDLTAGNKRNSNDAPTAQNQFLNS